MPLITHYPVHYSRSHVIVSHVILNPLQLVWQHTTIVRAVPQAGHPTRLEQGIKRERQTYQTRCIGAVLSPIHRKLAKGLAELKAKTPAKGK